MEFNQKQTEALLKRIVAKDEHAFHEFYEEWYPRAYYIALAITHHEADAKDVAQETMIEIHRSIDHLRDLKYFKLWLNRIIISKCNRLFRKKKAVTMDVELKNTLLSQEEERQEYLPPDHTHRQSDMAVLQKMLMRMQPIYAEVLVLMYFEQCSIKEIAEILQVPEGTVKSRLNSAKNLLRTQIDAYEQKEQIKLNFHVESLEALLVLAYADMAKQWIPSAAVSLFHSASHGSKLLSLITSKAVVCALSVMLTVCAVAAAIEVYEGTHSSYIQGTVREFAPVEFKHMEIHNDKEAYFVLMKYAHCEVELKDLSAAEREIIAYLIEQLNYPDSIYYRLWKNRK